ncbi:MAG: hypothetical protein ACRD1Z_20490 [Vicinamibacteria bacterium]
MAKSSKSQNPEFLEKRRTAIAELAKRRGQRSRLTLSAAAVDPRNKIGKIMAPVAFAVRPQPQN